MKYNQVFLPEVETDILNAVAWYENVSLGLGFEFRRMFFANVGELVWNPEMYRKVFKDFRRRLMNRFPYAVYYRLDSARIIIYGVFHCARDPKIVKKNIHSRK